MEPAAHQRAARLANPAPRHPTRVLAFETQPRPLPDVHQLCNAGVTHEGNRPKALALLTTWGTPRHPSSGQKATPQRNSSTTAPPPPQYVRLRRHGGRSTTCGLVVYHTTARTAPRIAQRSRTGARHKATPALLSTRYSLLCSQLSAQHCPLLSPCPLRPCLFASWRL
jgi:hypothetical protein